MRLANIGQFLNRDDALLKHGLIMFVASVVGSVLNYLYQFFMGRMLGPEQYGILGALLSFTYVLTVPAQTIQMSMAKLVAKLQATDREADIAHAIRHLGSKVLGLSLGGLLILLAGSVGIAQFLKIPSVMPVVILSLVFFFQLLVPVLNGSLLGLQRFVLLGLNQILNFGSKLLLGVALVGLGLGVGGALGGLVVGAAFSVGFGLYFLRDILSKTSPAKKLPRISSYSVYTLLAFMFLTLLYNLDILLVKRFFTSQEAGYYVAASTIARTVFFGSIAIAGAMFPKVVVWAENGDREMSRRLVRDALLYTGLLAGFGSFILLAFPMPVVSLLYGTAYKETGGLVGLFSVAMVFFSLSYILSLFHLALGNRRFILLLALAVVLEVTGILLFHTSLVQVVSVMTGTMAALFGCMALLVLKLEGKKGAEAET